MSSIWVPLGMLLFLAFLAEGITLMNSGNELLGALCILLGLAVVAAIWHRVNRSMSRATGQYGGWSLDARLFLVGVAILAAGLFLFLDPLQVIPHNIYQQGDLIGGLGLAIALFGFMWCILSLRE